MATSNPSLVFLAAPAAVDAARKIAELRGCRLADIIRIACVQTITSGKAPVGADLAVGQRSECVRIHMRATLKAMCADAAREAGMKLGTWVARSLQDELARIESDPLAERVLLAEIRRLETPPRLRAQA